MHYFLHKSSHYLIFCFPIQFTVDYLSICHESWLCHKIKGLEFLGQSATMPFEVEIAETRLISQCTLS